MDELTISQRPIYIERFYNPDAPGIYYDVNGNRIYDEKTDNINQHVTRGRSLQQYKRPPRYYTRSHNTKLHSENTSELIFN